MKVAGSSTISGGKLNEIVRTAGTTKINGNLECEEFRSSGSLKSSGSIIVNGDFHCAGSFNIAGSLSVSGNAKSSGSTTIDGEMTIKGYYSKAGTLKVGSHIEAQEGVKIAGLTKIHGSLMSKRDVDLRGTVTIDENIKAENVYIGMLIDLQPLIHPYKIYGNIVAENEVNIKRALVKGDIKGRTIIIGFGTEVQGEVYYIDNIEIHPRATLAKEPIHIKNTK
ncbi:MAG: polymer-forming cytoskeletal protein [Asgard group archaeon]|nr:polymer-forming cytoskeletal protein [Asgard group archaeon]